MRKNYESPVAKKVDFAFGNQVVAATTQIGNYKDPWFNYGCTSGANDDRCDINGGITLIQKDETHCTIVSYSLRG